MSASRIEARTMSACHRCGTANEPGGKYCTQCGAGLAEDAAVPVVAPVEVADAQRLFGENKVGAAYAAVEQILALDPNNVAALALKGDCMERSGDLAGALQAYEDVVTLRPDSPLDRIRVAQLRRSVAAQPLTVVERSDRWNAVLATVAAVVLLASTGSAIVLAGRRDTGGAPVEPAAQPQTMRPFLMPAPVPQEAKGEPKPGSAATAETSQPEETDRPDVNDNSRADRAGQRPPAPRGVGPGASLPPISQDSGYQPVTPDVTLTPNNTERPPSGDSGDPAPLPDRGDPNKEQTKEAGRQAVVDIRPSDGQEPKSVGGSVVRDDGNEGRSLIQVARQHFLAGEYEKAAKAYERAIKMGVSPASANHRLAQCYVNLNRKPEALAAYQKALSAYQRMVDQGVGDRALLERYMDECRQAIKLLQ